MFALQSPLVEIWKANPDGTANLPVEGGAMGAEPLGSNTGGVGSPREAVRRAFELG